MRYRCCSRVLVLLLLLLPQQPPVLQLLHALQQLQHSPFRRFGCVRSYIRRGTEGPR